MQTQIAHARADSREGGRVERGVVQLGKKLYLRGRWENSSRLVGS